MSKARCHIGWLTWLDQLRTMEKGLGDALNRYLRAYTLAMIETPRPGSSFSIHLSYKIKHHNARRNHKLGLPTCSIKEA